MFCDEIKIKLVAGKGGDGCISFRREKFVPKGGPDGGDGGHGGNIILKVNSQLNTLNHLANRKQYKAQDGINGQRKNMHGKNGEDLVLEVPKGTIVYDVKKLRIIADLTEKGNTLFSDNATDGAFAEPSFVVAKGGKGGLGNTHFVSSIHQAPKFAENGEPGESKDIILELKLVADIGLIGLPSAGKSTLISIISNARPKIAAYQFTTLIPNLGVVNMSQFGGDARDSFVVADIPGLIEGASQGKGLGHQFLKHITRTQIIIHIIDGSSDDLVKNYRIINRELKEFDPQLAKKEQLIVINKIDLLTPEELEKKKEKLIKISKQKEIYAISGINKEGVKKLIFKAFDKFKKLKEKKKVKSTKKENIPILKPHLEKTRSEISEIIRKKDHKIFVIEGKRIQQLTKMTDIKNPEGLERIYNYLSKSGIQKALDKHNANFGDIIRIDEKHIPYRKYG